MAASGKRRRRFPSPATPPPARSCGTAAERRRSSPLPARRRAGPPRSSGAKEELNLEFNSDRTKSKKVEREKRRKKTRTSSLFWLPKEEKGGANTRGCSARVVLPLLPHNHINFRLHRQIPPRRGKRERKSDCFLLLAFFPRNHLFSLSLAGSLNFFVFFLVGGGGGAAKSWFVWRTQTRWRSIPPLAPPSKEKGKKERIGGGG